MRLVQITDTHLLSERTAEYQGVVPHGALAYVLEAIAEEQPELDLLVLTGDLSQDESPESYDLLRGAIAPYRDRTVAIPGNHDDRDALRNAFPDLFDPDRPTLDFVRTEGLWRLIGMDSQIPGEVGGNLREAQLRWLDRTLASDPARPTLLFVHHPPMAVDVPWMDGSARLDSMEALGGVLARAKGVRAVLSGHLHMELEGRLGQVPVLTTPATAFQFVPGTPEKTVERGRGRGYRVLELGADGSLDTWVQRLDGPIPG